MKKSFILILVLFSSLSLVSAQETDIQKEKDLIKTVIQNAYVDGLCNNADLDAVKKGFHPEFTLLGIQGAGMWKLKIDKWMEYAKSGKEKGLKYSFQDELTTIKYQFIDVTGTAAIAKIDFFEGDTLKFVDYLSLLKFEGNWKIVSKTFYALPKEDVKK